MSDIVERLNAIWANDDHDRGCQGREYSCSCGYDNRTAKTAEDAATEISRLRQLLSEAEKREKEARKALEEIAAVEPRSNCDAGSMARSRMRDIARIYIRRNPK